MNKYKLYAHLILSNKTMEGSISSGSWRKAINFYEKWLLFHWLSSI